jgi:hypothetical protein
MPGRDPADACEHRLLICQGTMGEIPTDGLVIRHSVHPFDPEKRSDRRGESIFPSDDRIVKRSDSKRIPGRQNIFLPTITDDESKVTIEQRQYIRSVSSISFQKQVGSGQKPRRFFQSGTQLPGIVKRKVPMEIVEVHDADSITLHDDLFGMGMSFPIRRPTRRQNAPVLPLR